jgi:regulator of protease activity HflC (stomatin/prohibitin superfamily)
MSAITIVLVLLAVLAIAVVSLTVKIVPQARAGIVERFGKYRTTLPAGLNIVVPFVDKVRYMIDLREQVVSFPPQPVITEDNLTVSIDTVIYFQVTDAVSATYEIADYIQAIEQLTMTTLRNITGGMTLEHALTSRDQINSGLRGELDGATGKWGIRVNRVELKGIDPPPSIIDAMEKQMRAERDKRAAILTAEGERQSEILTAEGEKQAQILTAQGDRQGAILRAQGEGQAILTVFQAIHDGNPDQKLLSYQYLQMLPKIAEGENVSTWIIPAEITQAIGTLGGTFGKIPTDGGGSKKRVDLDEPVVADETEDADTQAAVEQALKAAKDAEGPGGGFKGPGQVMPTSVDEPSTEEPPRA